jgi:beta-glucosidase
MRNALFSASLFVFGLTGTLAQQAPRLAYQNEKAPVPTRVRDLLGRMTVEEKVAQLQSGINMPSFGPQASSIFSKD